MLKFFLSGLLLFTVSLPLAANTPIGYKERHIQNNARETSMPVSLWYPTGERKPMDIVGASSIFYGQHAIVEAEPLSGVHPLVLLSHRARGNRHDLNWLASKLARHGYIVAAPEHFSTDLSTANSNLPNLWSRPHDLSLVIDALSTEPGLAGTVAPNQIAAIGHSLGAWTVTALAGARFSTARFARNCTIYKNPQTCEFADELVKSPALTRAIEKDLSDSRVGVVVALDIGMARGFTPESIASVEAPFLVLRSGIDIDGVPIQLESGYLVTHLPQLSSRYIEVDDANHYSFLRLCQPGARKPPQKSAPAQSYDCFETANPDRASLHQHVEYLITDFLSQSLFAE